MMGALLFTLPISLNAQHKVTGTITDENGEPLPGATIQVLNTYQGVTAGLDGSYSLTLRDGNYELKADFIGYKEVIKEVQVQGSDVELNFSLSPQDFVTDEVVITATRADADAPISQTTRNRQQIEAEYSGQDAAFLIDELSPSVVSYSESGTSLSNYGGLRLRGIDQSRINMTLNGVPLNDLIDQGVFFSNFTDFGNSIESVQIQRGVGTSVNGTSSYAGSINFESISLSDTEPSSEVQLTGGSFATMRASAEVSTGKMDNGFSFYTRYTHTLSDGYRYNASTNSRSFFFSGGYFGKKNTLKFTGFYGKSENGLAYGPVAISDIENDPRTNYVSENDVDNFGQWMAQLQHILVINDHTTLVSTAYYGGAGGDFPFGFDDGSGTFTQINYPLYNDHIGLMSVIKTRLADEKLHISGGVHGYRFLRQNLEQIVPDYSNPYYDDESIKDEFSGFATLSYKWNGFNFYGDVQARYVQLELYPDNEFLGLQVKRFRHDWLFINPKGGINYTVNDHVQAYASFGRTGREPTRFDLLGSTQINLSNYPLVAGDNAVQPEFVNDLELGVKLNWPSVRVNVNFFHMQFENEIAPIGEFIPQGFVQVYKNQEPSNRTGIEIDYAWEFLSIMRLRGHLTYMQSDISSYTPAITNVTYTDVTPILSPEWNVQTTLEANIANRVSLGVTGRYLSEAYLELTNDPTLTIPSSFVADLNLSYRFYKEHSISIQLNNLLDQRYYTYGAPVFTMTGTEPGYYVQPPRHVYVTLRMRF